MTVGTGEAFRYIVIHPGKYDFEAKNPGALFVALSRAKSAGGEGVDPDFALDSATNRAPGFLASKSCFPG